MTDIMGRAVVRRFVPAPAPVFASALALALAVALAVASSFLSVAAHAHSPLTSTNPSDGAVVARAPEAIEMNFRGKARLIRFSLTGADNGEVALGKDHLMVEASYHRVTLPPVGADEFTAEWRAMSEDGHILKGDFSFRVGAD